MADRPILFSAPMVRAILREIEQPGTGKTQTRRVLSNDKPMSLFNGRWADSYVLDPGNASWRERDLRYSVGDRLYVREAWRTAAHLDRFAPKVVPVDTPVFFEADAGGEVVGATGKFRQGMHMPRWASRITLIVTDFRVQRLQEIDELDARAEGVRDGYGDPYHQWEALSYRRRFNLLWDHLNADRGFGWDTNPWVVAYTFKPILGKIDQVRP